MKINQNKKNIPPFVSIIIPVKNEEKRISLCFQALTQVDYAEQCLEIIVIDNGSTDCTVSIVKSLNYTVHVKPGITIAAMRNFGAELAQGEYVAFIDADVLVSRGWLEAAITSLQTKKFDCITGYIGIPQNASWVTKTWCLGRDARNYTNTIQDISWTSSMNMVIKRSVFEDVGGFSEELTTCEDVDLSRKIKLKKYSIGYFYKVKVIHTGEAATIFEFFRKERWRGYSSLDLLKSYYWKEILSSLQFVLFNIALVFLCFSMTTSKASLMLLATLMTMLLPIIKSITFLNKANEFKIQYLFPMIFLMLVYYFARTCALYDRLIFRQSFG